MLDPHLLANAIDLLLLAFYNAYEYAAIVLTGLRHRPKPDFVLTVYHVSKWPALAMIVLDPLFMIYQHHQLSAMEVVCDLACGVFWWVTRNLGDDDWWHKREKKMAAKIAVSDNKLVVVPEPA